MKWTRTRYLRAAHLSRLLSRFYDMPDKPALVDEFHRLWERHPPRDDPLVDGRLRWRLAELKGDDIPF